MIAARDAATVSSAFFATAAQHGDRPFLHVLDETAAVYGIAAGEIFYAAFAAEVQSLQRSYASAGFGAGHRVGLLLENRPAFFRHWFALNALGASVVPINPDLRATELEYLVTHSEMVGAVVLPARCDDIASAADAGRTTVAIISPEGPIPRCHAPHRSATPPGADTECALLYTSGTTGRPKGCVLTNTYYLNSGRWYLDAGGYVQIREGQERMLTPLPLFHMNAMATSAMTMVLSGGCLTVLDRFHPRSWWASVRATRATIIHYLGIMPPILMNAVASPSDREHNVKFGFGAGIDRRLHASFEARFGFPLIEAWAMTETGGGVVIAALHDPRNVGTSCFGKPGSESEVRVVCDDGTDAPPDVPGELLVRRAGPHPRHGFFKEYLKDPEATAEAWADGWFHTGDIVKRDASGHFYFIDRKKNVIRRSGENIAAVEVESVLQQHPDVAAVAVGPIPDAMRGDEVFALVVPKQQDMTAAERAMRARAIADFCRERLAYYKSPGFIAFVDSLPLTATQKIQRGALKPLIAKLADDAVAIDLRDLKKRAS